MTIGWAYIVGAVSLWVCQIVWKDLKEADKRLESEN
jgi:predicted Co/Zn/Cd cation transporter (cation efflux family)